MLERFAMHASSHASKNAPTRYARRTHFSVLRNTSLTMSGDVETFAFQVRHRSDGPSRRALAGQRVSSRVRSLTPARPCSPPPPRRLKSTRLVRRGERLARAVASVVLRRAEAARSSFPDPLPRSPPPAAEPDYQHLLQQQGVCTGETNAQRLWLGGEGTGLEGNRWRLRGATDASRPPSRPHTVAHTSPPPQEIFLRELIR